MLLKYEKELKKIIEKISSIPSGSQLGEGLKILTPQQMFTCLPILLAQVQAGNNSQSLKRNKTTIVFSIQVKKDKQNSL